MECCLSRQTPLRLWIGRVDSRQSTLCARPRRTWTIMKMVCGCCNVARKTNAAGGQERVTTQHAASQICARVVCTSCATSALRQLHTSQVTPGAPINAVLQVLGHRHQATSTASLPGELKSSQRSVSVSFAAPCLRLGVTSGTSRTDRLPCIGFLDARVNSHPTILYACPGTYSCTLKAVTSVITSPSFSA